MSSDDGTPPEDGVPADERPEAIHKIIAGAKVVSLDQVRSKKHKHAPNAGSGENKSSTQQPEPGERGMKQADRLIEVANSAELFHAADGTGFAELDVKGHREIWPIRGKGFRRLLARRFFEETRGAPSSEAMNSALNVIEANAQFDAPEREVFVRVGGANGRLYLDLADETWQAVEVDATGWRVIDKPPVRFRRAAGMRPLPMPVAGGSIVTLRSFLNVRSDADFVLVAAWLLAAFRNHGPYPVLVLTGEHGTAKSTFSKILRGLVDPNTAALRTLPRDDRDLFIAASNGFVLAFDNLSALKEWISDALCRLATGGGYGTRQLHTDQDEVLFDAQRPVILNGIEDFVTRPDLADRAIFLTLEPIAEEKRRSEAELWAEFKAECPRILGALLDAIATGLKRLPETRLDRLPRMADFALWVTACETGLWPAGTFSSAYCGNRDEVIDNVIEADPVASVVCSLMATRSQWEGTATALLAALSQKAGEKVTHSNDWPKSANVLSGRMRRAATFLRQTGIEIARDREGHRRNRKITITRADNCKVQPSASSAAPADIANRPPVANPAQTEGEQADANMIPADNEPSASVRSKPLEIRPADDADGADAKSPPVSAGWRVDL
jgi:hypothetical protein